MESKFVSIMKNHTDSELLEILTIYENEYQPEAIDAAKAEFVKRNLSITQIEDAKREIELKKNEKEKRKTLPLQVYWKILTFLIPGVLNLILSATFKADGYDRRFKEAWCWTFYGFCFYLILIVFLNLF